MAAENIVSIVVKATNLTGAGFAEAKAGAKELAAEEKVAGDEAEVMGEKTSLSSRMAAAGGAAWAKFGLMGSAALAGVGYESIKMAMSFQSAMERLVTQAGVPQKELGSLKQGVLSLAGQVGFSPDSLATSLYHVASSMASLGTTGPQMLKMVQTAAEGAKVGGANLEDVTNALTAAVSSGIPGVQNYSQAMGALNAIVGAGDMKMQDLAEAMGTGVLAVVKGYGLSLKDVGAALAVFGDNNIRGAHAATSLRMAVQSLAVPAAAGKKLLADMGLSMTSLADTMRQHGLLAALEELQAKFKASGVTAQQQGDLITQIFGKKAGVGLAVLMDQMDRLKSKYPAITEGANKFGQAWAATQQTTKQKMDELRATFDSLMTSIGTKLLPVISAFASVLLKFAPALSQIAPAVLIIVAAFTAWAGIMKVINILSDLNPWVLAIMAVVVAATLLVEHWKQIENVAKEVWHAVTAAVAAAFDWIKSHWPLLLGILTGPIGMATLWIVQHWHQIVSGAQSMIHDLVSWFTRLPGMILNAVGNLGNLLWNVGASIINGLWNGLKSAWGAVSGWLSSVGGWIASLKGPLPKDRQLLVPHGQAIMQGLMGGMDSQMPALRSHLSGISATIGGMKVPAGGAGGAGSGPVVLQFHGGGSGLDALFMTWLKNNVRASGGDPRIFNRKVVLQ